MLATLKNPFDKKGVEAIAKMLNIEGNCLIIRKVESKIVVVTDTRTDKKILSAIGCGKLWAVMMDEELAEFYGYALWKNS